MGNFDFPTNIKQIGTIESGLRIYVEDYVCLYLQQYANSSDYDEKLGILVGKHLTIDNQSVIFISGAILGKYCIMEDDIMQFTDKSFDYIVEQMNLHFNDLEIVGWMQSQPGYGTFLNHKYENYHMDNFRKPYQVLFVMDPVEKLNSFYYYNETMDKLRENPGYFIYYEKNPQMHEYMIKNRIVKKVQEEDIKSLHIESKSIEKEKNEVIKQNKSEYNNKEKIYKLSDEGLDENLDYESLVDNKDKFRRDNFDERLKKITKQNREERIKEYEEANSKQEHKRVVNMLISTTGIMFLICFVLGISLLRSRSELSYVQKQVQELNSSYQDVLSTLGDTTKQTFASQNNNIKDEGNLLIEENGNEVLADAKKDDNKDTEGKNKKESLKESENVNTKEKVDNSLEESKNKELHNKQESVETSKTINIPDTYKVQRGDNLYKISEKFYGSRDMVNKILEVNNITDPDKILFGKVIKLPK